MAFLYVIDHTIGHHIGCIFMPIQDYAYILPNIVASIAIKQNIDNCTNITIMFYAIPFIYTFILSYTDKLIICQ